MKLSIIMPTYNEAGNIMSLIETINQQSDLKKYAKEFIVIDDNSPDGTSEIVKKFVKTLPIKLFIRKNERGLATAILHGIKHSTGELIVLMDTDFNHQPQDVPRLLQPILKGDSDLVIGSRYISGGGMDIIEANKIQFFLSKAGNFFVNRILLRMPVHESLSGFVAFKRKILNDLDINSIFQGYGEYCICLLFKTYRKGFSIKEIPVVYGGRQYGQSKSRLAKMTINYLKAALSLKLGR